MDGWVLDALPMPTEVNVSVSFLSKKKMSVSAAKVVC
jgi:hypothetical protein